VADEDNFDPPTTDDNVYQGSLSNNVSCGTVTVNTTSNLELQEDEKKDAIENVKGILKNKPIKPTPYHLGEDYFMNSNSDSDSGKWGRPVEARAEKRSAILEVDGDAAQHGLRTGEFGEGGSAGVSEAAEEPETNQREQTGSARQSKKFQKFFECKIRHKHR
jgi:hypothetical protein